MPQATDHEPEVRRITVTLDAAEKWQGTVGRPRRSQVRVQLEAPAMLEPQNLQRTYILRELLHPLNTVDAMEFLTRKVGAAKSNQDFFDSMAQ